MGSNNNGGFSRFGKFSATLTERVMVAPQIAAPDFAALAAAGVRTVINNRPDGEDAGQLASAQAARLAAKAGLAYRHIPVTGLRCI